MDETYHLIGDDNHFRNMVNELSTYMSDDFTSLCLQGIHYYDLPMDNYEKCHYYAWLVGTGILGQSILK